MDEYFLTRDDWDTIIELGVGDNHETVVTKKISTATKTAFTKKYVSTLCGIPPANINVGTRLETIPSHSIRRRLLGRHQRRSPPLVPRPTSKKHLTWVPNLADSLSFGG